ncbi:MAG: glycosyltransferase [Thermoleophilaceae bacterium]
MLSETFVSGELRELRRLGEDPALVAIVRGADAPPPGCPDARYATELRAGEQLLALAALLVRRPLRTLHALARPGFGGSARDVAALAPLARELAGARHVHAHFADRPAALAARLAALTGSSFSFTAHAWDVFTGWDRVDEKLEAAAFGVTVCEYNRRYIAGRAPEQADKLEVVVCGVDPGEFRRSRPYDPDGPLVAVGRLVEQKGFADLVQAAAIGRGRIPQVVIAGEGPERARLEALIAESGADVRLAGALPHAQIRALYESASAAVLPCVVAVDGSRDSMPVSLKEAMALELPVVGTNEVGIPEMVGPDRGLLVPPGDPEALAAALIDLHGRPAQERAAMGKTGRAFVAERCNLRTETARLRALFPL